MSFASRLENSTEQDIINRVNRHSIRNAWYEKNPRQATTMVEAIEMMLSRIEYLEWAQEQQD